ncbi:MAG: N-acetyltransferase, partial [Acidobacteriota bacterium]|nr:N-acetyltransferase [Acidobacteriota bacterium]
MAGIQITAVDGKKALHEFVEFPFTLLRHEPNWVPPLRIAAKELLDRGKHPFYSEADAEFFLARRDGKVVGRVAAILNRAHNRFHEENAGFFGFFDCENDPETARALLAQARSWLAARGATVFRGPVNPSTNYECGLLVEGFDSDPMVMMPWNPPYYAVLLEQAGLVKAKDLLAYLSNANTISMDKIGRVADKALSTNGVRVRPINM